MSVRRCQQEVDPEEFVWWQAYDRRHPLDDRAANWRAAKVCQTVAGQYRRASLADYLPAWNRPPTRRTTWRDWKAGLTAIAKRRTRGNRR